ncbi:MAG TPA: PilZ domain-containing protein [Xanthobacteraceae bacterium]|nr:PilZ domain-containing protein [Xanthobacteraceae bacterium]
MSRERRRSFRVQWESPAYVELKDGRGRISCIVNNLSNGGARITCAEPLPDEFILKLTPGRGHPRECRVVWRRNQDLGVQFVDRLWDPPLPARGRVPEWIS